MDSIMTRLENKIIDLILQADKQWSLFNPDERILIAISGGKDSLALLHLLELMNKNIKAVHVTLRESNSIRFIEENNLQNKVSVIPANILDNLKGNKNRCFTCSRKRKRCLVEFAEQHNIHTIAIGHHKDDVIETLLMNLIYSRELSTVKPKQPLFQGHFSIIRPLYLVPEELLASLLKEQQWTITKPICHEQEHSKRKYIKNLIRNLILDHPKIDPKDNIFSSLKSIKPYFLPYPIE